MTGTSWRTLLQNLHIFQSLWAMDNLRSRSGRHSLEESMQQISQAAFQGISAVWLSRDNAKSIWETARDFGLQVEGICFPKSVDELERALALSTEFPIKHLNIHADARPRTIEECAPLVEGWLRLVEQADIPVYFETHRDRLTNDLFFTLELVRRYPQIKLLADLSHYVVARGFAHPIAEENQQAILEILDRTWAFHGRVASGEQVQVELSFPQHQPWVNQFVTWWTHGFHSWRRRASSDADLVFTCELGPQPYAISDAEGFDRTDRWSETLQLRDLARLSWQKALVI